MYKAVSRKLSPADDCANIRKFSESRGKRGNQQAVNKKMLAGGKMFVSLQQIWSPKCWVDGPVRVRRQNRLGVKRESGENPEQSRCCELRDAAAPREGEPLCAAIGAWEGRAAESKSEDLPSRWIEGFRGKSRKSMTRRVLARVASLFAVSCRKLF